MNVYQLILENEYFFNRMVKLGKISLKTRMEMEIYAYFKNTTGRRMIRYSKTSVEFGLSEKTIMRAVKEMEFKF